MCFIHKEYSYYITVLTSLKLLLKISRTHKKLGKGKTRLGFFLHNLGLRKCRRSDNPDYQLDPGSQPARVRVKGPFLSFWKYGSFHTERVMRRRNHQLPKKAVQIQNCGSVWRTLRSKKKFGNQTRARSAISSKPSVAKQKILVAELYWSVANARNYKLRKVYVVSSLPVDTSTKCRLFLITFMVFTLSKKTTKKNQ